MQPVEVIRGLDFASYQAIEAEHSGHLRKILTSPLAYKNHADIEDRDTLRLGRAVHTAILEPHRFAEQYVCWSGGARRGKAWDDYCACAEAGKQTILKEDQLDLVVAISKAALAHPMAKNVIGNVGDSELTIVWTHPRTGVRIKTRIDLLTKTALVDLKTCRDPSPALFSTSAARFGYHFQLALYADAVYAAGLGPVEVKIVAVQSASPFDVVVYSVDEDVLSRGRDEYENVLDALVACRKSGKWPGQAVSEEVKLRLPAWVSPIEDETITIGGEPLP